MLEACAKRERGPAMPRSDREFRRTVTIVVAACAVVLGGCSGMPGLSDVKLLPSMSSFVPTNSNAFNEAAVNTKRPVNATDLVDAQGLCAGAAGQVASAGETVQPFSRGVGLDMTECEVVQALGVPQSTQIGTHPGGQRSVTMLFSGVERAGVYRFTRGRLVSIERTAGPASPNTGRRSTR